MDLISSRTNHDSFNDCVDYMLSRSSRAMSESRFGMEHHNYVLNNFGAGPSFVPSALAEVRGSRLFREQTPLDFYRANSPLR